MTAKEELNRLRTLYAAAKYRSIHGGLLERKEYEERRQQIAAQILDLIGEDFEKFVQTINNQNHEVQTRDSDNGGM